MKRFRIYPRKRKRLQRGQARLFLKEHLQKRFDKAERAGGHRENSKEIENSVGSEPISVREYLQQWYQVRRKGELMKQRKRIRRQMISKRISSSEGREVTTNSSGYATSDEIEKLFRKSNQQVNHDPTPEKYVSDYAPLPADCFTELLFNKSDKTFSTEESVYSQITTCFDDYENEPCSSQQADERTRSKLVRFNSLPDTEEETSRLICRGYVSASKARALAQLYTSKYSTRDHFSEERFTQKTFYSKENLETWPTPTEDTAIFVQKREEVGSGDVLEATNSIFQFSTAMSNLQHQIIESGCFKTRYIRGRYRLNAIRERQERLGARESSTMRTDFTTLGEVLIENGISPNEVIICSLCRLIIPNNVQDQFFMRPCDCLDKFVHAECALLHQYEMIHQECPDCRKFKVDRIVCRSRSPSPTRGEEEVALHRLNAEMVHQLEEPLYRRRLPDEFDHDCHICLDKRVPRHDRFEKLDSRIIRACRCRVTAHNECAVKSLLLTRKCRYCDYRIGFETKRAKSGCCSLKLVIPFLLSIGTIVSSASFVLYLIATVAFFENHKNDLLFRIVMAVIIPSSIVFLLAWLFRKWKRCAQRPNEDAEVKIMPFQLPGPYRARKVKDLVHWEEIPFKQRNLEPLIECWTENED